MNTTPSSFTFEIDEAELRDVNSWASRYAPSPAADFAVQLSFLPGQHRWLAREANVTAWWDPLPSRGPSEGVLAIPLFFLNNAAELFTGGGAVTFHIDIENKLLVARAGATEMGVDLPDLPVAPYSLDFESDRHIVVSAGDLAHMGFVMMTMPVDLSESEIEFPFPFTSVKVEKTSLRATRDWRAFGGPRLTVGVPARSDFEGLVSFFSEVLGREFFWADIEGGETEVSIAFSSVTPNIAMLTCANWGLRIELGYEQVFRYRRELEAALGHAGYDVTRDPRIGWDAEVHFTHKEQPVTACIVPGETVHHTMIRLSTLVMPDAPWNLDVANEVNAWNNQWKYGKLVLQENDLYALSDFPAAEIEHLPTLVADIVSTTQRVRDVIGVFR